VKPVSLIFAALLLPPAALAQAVHFNVQCLPPAQQEEVKAKAQAISDEAERKRRENPAFAAGAGLIDTRTYRDGSEVALAECASAAKKAGRAPLEACEKEFVALRVSAQAVDDLARGVHASVRPIDLEERARLEALRAQYPACDQPVTVKR
jgi:hypothetical protein